MRSKKIRLTNFSLALHCDSLCVRPDTEQQFHQPTLESDMHLLTRGAGLSYNDSCLNQKGLTIDLRRLNHLLDFDPKSGIVSCQAGTRFRDLFLLHPEFIPPVLPGTLQATLGGGIAHDIHGKNNPQAGALGQHLCGFDLFINNKVVHCSADENSRLFEATIGGLGLTGVILRVSLRMKKASRTVCTQSKSFASSSDLISYMATEGMQYDYQAAWMDLLSPTPRAVLSLAQHCDDASLPKKFMPVLPKIPVNVIHPWTMSIFNRYYFNKNRAKQILSLEEFNNPLDKIKYWNRLYGPKGLVQFQALFDEEQAPEIIPHLQHLIKTHHAHPTLAVLKLFKQKGAGLLSFCKPGFTLAIDFAHHKHSLAAIGAMNQFIADRGGRVYLAKDLLLTPELYRTMYDQQARFISILRDYKCSMRSDLATRLEIIP